nr:hypothetical protein [Rhodococcus wratislaviensis]
MNRKKVHWLWKEERLQVRIYYPRTRSGISSCPQIEADARMWWWGYRFPVRLHHRRQSHQDRLEIDEHTRQSLLDIVEHSITAQRLTDELDIPGP